MSVEIAFEVKYTGPVPGMTMGRREFGRLLAFTWKQLGQEWYDEFRMKHFTGEGAREYGYQPRKGQQKGSGGKEFWSSYTGRKKRQFGHTDPLVFSGETRDMVRREKHPRISSTRNGCKVFVRAPKLNWRHPKSSIRMADEMRTVSRGEEDYLVEFFNTQIERRLRTYKRQVRKRIG